MRNQIFAHRGMWSTTGFEPNSLEALEAAMESGFSIEFDIRDHDGRVVVSHDPPKSAEHLLSFEDLLNVAGRYPESILAINVKSDGLISLLGPNAFRNEHFFFDLSVPESLKYKRSGFSVADRLSEVEAYPLEEPQWLWIDSFFRDLPPRELEKIASGSELALGLIFVSSELHGRSHHTFWKNLAPLLVSRKELAICTDYPEEFAEIGQID